MGKKSNVLLVVGIGLAVLLICGVFGFVKIKTIHPPADTDMILIRSGITGKSYEISRETDAEVFNGLISIELEINGFSPLTSFSMGHEYILTYYKNGEAVMEFMGKGGKYQTYKFPFFYNTSGDIASIIGKYIQNVGTTAP